MKGYVPLVATLALGVSGVAARPPLAPVTLPGQGLGETTGQWIFPYVRVVYDGFCLEGEECGGCCLHWNTAVRWFDEGGGVQRDISGKRVCLGNGFVREDTSGGSVIHGIASDWHLELGELHETDGIVGNYRSATCAHQRTVSDSVFRIDVYSSGERSASLGPFMRTKASRTRLGPDGSFSVFVGTPDPTARELVVADAGGRETLRVRCGLRADRPRVAPQGRGVLIRKKNHTSYYTADGTETRLDLWIDTRLLTWVPESDTALFLVFPSNPTQLALLDCRSGAEGWTIDCESVREDGVQILGSRVFLSRLRDGRRAIDVLDLGTGSLLAQWESDLDDYQTPGKIHVHSGRLYFVTDEAFSEVSPEYMTIRTSGWK
jgi:hypothetical protein